MTPGLRLPPLRARRVGWAEDWPWSSPQAQGEDDGLVTARPVLDRVDRFAELIEAGADDPAFAALRAAETTGRPLGTAAFVADLERRLAAPSPDARPAEASDRSHGAV